MQVFKTTRRKPRQLAEAPVLPKDVAYLVEYYWEVFDGEPLSYQKIHYWSQVMKRDVAAWEAQALITIDHSYWKIKGEETK